MSNRVNDTRFRHVDMYGESVKVEIIRSNENLSNIPMNYIKSDGDIDIYEICSTGELIGISIY